MKGEPKVGIKQSPFAWKLTADVVPLWEPVGASWPVSIPDELLLQLPGSDEWRDASLRTR